MKIAAIDIGSNAARMQISSVLTNKNKISFKKDYRSLLKDRDFVIYANSNKTDTLYIGLIIELNPQLRPSIGFQSIRDFLSAWSDAKPEKKTL